MTGFDQGDLVSAIDAYGRPVSGIATDSGVGGYVTVQPLDRPDGGVWVTPAAVRVRVGDCQLVQRHEDRLREQAFRDREHAGRVATWRREAELRERARER